jgi:hypothetical protein
MKEGVEKGCLGPCTVQYKQGTQPSVFPRIPLRRYAAPRIPNLTPCSLSNGRVLLGRVWLVSLAGPAHIKTQLVWKSAFLPPRFFSYPTNFLDRLFRLCAVADHRSYPSWGTVAEGKQYCSP